MAQEVKNLKSQSVTSNAVIPTERIERSIFLIRGHKVMLDADLAELYGIETKLLNRAVRRNLSRFPQDFMLELTREEDHLWRASAAGLLGLAYWTSGDLEAGHRAYTECVAGLRRAGHVADTFGCAIALADIRRTQGRLTEAMRTYEHTLQLAPSPPGGPVLRGTADMYVGMSEICRERNDLQAATELLERSQELGEHIARSRAHSHPDADFPCPLGHRN